MEPSFYVMNASKILANEHVRLSEYNIQPNCTLQICYKLHGGAFQKDTVVSMMPPVTGGADAAAVLPSNNSNGRSFLHSEYDLPQLFIKPSPFLVKRPNTRCRFKSRSRSLQIMELRHRRLVQAGCSAGDPSYLANMELKDADDEEEEGSSYSITYIDPAGAPRVMENSEEVHAVRILPPCQKKNVVVSSKAAAASVEREKEANAITAISPSPSPQQIVKRLEATMDTEVAVASSEAASLEERVRSAAFTSHSSSRSTKTLRLAKTTVIKVTTRVKSWTSSSSSVGDAVEVKTAEEDEDQDAESCLLVDTERASASFSGSNAEENTAVVSPSFVPRRPNSLPLSSSSSLLVTSSSSSPSRHSRIMRLHGRHSP